MENILKKFKRTGLIFTAALTAAIAVPAAAQAADDRAGPYVSAFTGLAFQSSQTNTFENQSLGLSFDTGFVLGGSVGYKFGEGALGGFRVELEASYREGDVDDGLDGFTPGDQTFSGDTSSLGVLANLLYDFDTISDSFIPYIGIGAGIGGVESDVVIQTGSTAPATENGDPTRLEFGGPTRTEFLYQAIAGVTIPLTDRFDLFVDGRYYSAPGVDFDLIDFNNNSTTFESSYNNYQVQAGIRFRF